MTYTTMVYKAPSGQWSWSVLDDQRMPVVSGAGYATEAEADAEADELLATYIDEAEPTEHQDAAYWRDHFDAYENGRTMVTGMPLDGFGQNLSVDQLDAMIDGAKASKHAAVLRTEIERWQRLLATKLDPYDGLRADGEPLCGIDAIDYPPDIAHPGNGAHVDINFGVDYEVALERLNGIAGRLFTQYRATKVGGTPEATEQARTAYVEAQERCKSLRPNDHETIRSILGE